MSLVGQVVIRELLKDLRERRVPSKLKKAIRKRKSDGRMSK